MPGDVFKNKIRLRVNGILVEDNSVLLVQLKSPVTDELVWMPPGGGLQFCEPMKTGLQREFLEETGLEIEKISFAFINELVNPPFHTVECYFWVRKAGGKLGLGSDPELAKDAQILCDLRWIPIDKLDQFCVVPGSLTGLLQRLLRTNRNPDSNAETSYFSQINL